MKKFKEFFGITDFYTGFYVGAWLGTVAGLIIAFAVGLWLR